MRRPLRSLARLAFLVLFLAWAPGCITIGLWESASGVGDNREAERVQRARLIGDVLELIVDFEGEGPHLVRVHLGAATRGFYDGKPTLRGEVLGFREEDLEPVHLELSQGGLLGESLIDEPPALTAPEEGAPAPGAPPPPPPKLYWNAHPEAEGSLILCLRRPGLEPLYAEVRGLGGSAAAPFVYVGAGLLTPVTFAVDVVTFPFQVVMIFVFASAIDDIFN